jgi:hypothetical protein
MLIAIKTSNLGNNNAAQALLSSDQGFLVPPIFYDIAESLPWILEVEAFPLSFAY